MSNSSLTRRGFLGAAAAATAALAAGCAPESQVSLSETGDVKESPAGATLTSDGHRLDPEFNPAMEGTWTTVPCWHNCGGSRCMLRAYTVDGIVMRVKTDDTHEDSFEYPQQRACPRGRSQRAHLFGADRIKYPMKRVHWQPGGGENAHGELRGKDEWERISWDEACELIAEEVQRIYAEYGGNSVMIGGYAGSELENVLDQLGGHVPFLNSNSYGTYFVGTPDLGITYDINPDIQGSNDRLDLLNADTIVIYSANPAWCSAGNPMYHFMRAKDNGTEFVYVGPDYNMTASTLDARWIRVRPGSDLPFLLAVAYVMITEDDNGSIIDWDFLHKYCVGFDAESMPEDATVNENFHDYVLGKYDGIPKTPEWATEYCGTPVEDIEWYARLQAKSNNVMNLHSYAAARYNGAEYFPQIFLAVGCMGGHLGKPGNATGGIFSFSAANSGKAIVQCGNPLPDINAGQDGGGTAFSTLTISNPVDDVVTGPEVWSALLNKSYTYMGTSSYGDGSSSLVAGEKRPIDIHAYFGQANEGFSTNMDINKAIEVFRGLDLVVCHTWQFRPTAQYADIVVPCTTRWENAEYEAGMTSTQINRDFMLIPQTVCEPLYEAKSDRQFVSLLAEKCGLDPNQFYTRSDAQRRFDTVLTSTIRTEDGTDVQPLVTVTQEKIDELGLEGAPQQGVIDYDEFIKTGSYQVPRTEDDNWTWIAYSDFIADPEANPLPSRSGKFEIYCQQRADKLNLMGVSDFEFKPYPVFMQSVNNYEDTFSDWDSKTKGDYPLQCFQPHYLRRAHTILENVPWLREAYANPFYMNSKDAADRGLEDGDAVLVSTQFGRVVRTLCIDDCFMEGVCAIPHGGWVEMDEETGIDLGASDSTLNGSYFAESLSQGFNSNVVQVEKYTGAIEQDVDKPLPMPTLVNE